MTANVALFPNVTHASCTIENIIHLCSSIRINIQLSQSGHDCVSAIIDEFSYHHNLRLTARVCSVGYTPDATSV